ncbi:type II secretion system protein [Cysteiniphilum marinum]|uniref:type II secretion system protein n=1 Tax=Cysteiniphilum marinum TaxID=2774191 RepID=UPI00193BC2AF|nr:prepilin-type N-terminal cleavage/methylation domain-containing protein [Cysteiniphilum marinum]
MINSTLNEERMISQSPRHDVNDILNNDTLAVFERKGRAFELGELGEIKAGKTMQFKAPKNQQGFSLIELMIVLGIIGVISVIVATFASGIWTSSRVKQTQDLIDTMSPQIKTIYAPMGGVYTGLTTKSVLSTAPKGMVYDSAGGKVIGTPWYSKDKSSVVEIEPDSSTTQYTITLKQIPNKECGLIGAKYLNDHADKVTANGSVAINPATLDTACGAGSSGKSDLSITFS